MNLFGLVMEQLNSGAEKQSNVKWGPFVWGSIAGIAPWVAILLYMFGTGNFDMVPWFVWAIVGTYFVAFNTFPINMILQYKRVGKWKDYALRRAGVYRAQPGGKIVPRVARALWSDAAVTPILSASKNAGLPAFLFAY